MDDSEPSEPKPSAHEIEIVDAESVLVGPEAADDSALLPPPPPLAQPTNKLGVAAVIAAVVSLVMFSPLAPVAVVLSMLGLRKSPRALAVAGLIISAFSFATLFWGGIFGYYLYSQASMQTVGTTIFNTNQTQMSIQTEAGTLADDWRASGSLPTQAEGDTQLGGQSDSWGNPFYYELVEEESSGKTGFLIRSYGPDETADTIDDIVVGPIFSPDDANYFDYF